MVSSRSLFNISIAIYAYFFPAIIVHLLKCAFLLWVGKHFKKGFPGGSVVKNPLAMQEMWVPSLGQEDPREEGMAFTPVYLPGESHGQRTLVGYSP